MSSCLVSTPNRYEKKLPTTWHVKGHEKASSRVETTVLPLEVTVNGGYRSPTSATVRTPFRRAIVLRALTASIRREVAPATSCRVPLLFSDPLAPCWRG